jgi:hypothetical protein
MRVLLSRFGPICSTFAARYTDALAFAATTLTQRRLPRRLTIVQRNQPIRMLLTVNYNPLICLAAVASRLSARFAALTWKSRVCCTAPVYTSHFCMPGPPPDRSFRLSNCLRQSEGARRGLFFPSQPPPETSVGYNEESDPVPDQARPRITMGTEKEAEDQGHESFRSSPSPPNQDLQGSAGRQATGTPPFG